MKHDSQSTDVVSEGLKQLHLNTDFLRDSSSRVSSTASSSSSSHEKSSPPPIDSPSLCSMNVDDLLGEDFGTDCPSDHAMYPDEQDSVSRQISNDDSMVLVLVMQPNNHLAKLENKFQSLYSFSTETAEGSFFTTTDTQLADGTTRISRRFLGANSA